MEQQERAWKDARELEYLRIDNALRARMNYTVIRNVYSILRQPDVLLQLVELDSDIWDCLRPYFGTKDDRRMKLDKDIDWMIETAYAIAEDTKDQYTQVNELGNIDIALDDLNRIRTFFKKEKEMYREMMDMRHEKGLDVGMRPSYSKADKAKAITGIARQSYEDSDG